jgi:hypothetical protein
MMSEWVTCDEGQSGFDWPMELARKIAVLGIILTFLLPVLSTPGVSTSGMVSCHEISLKIALSSAMDDKAISCDEPTGDFTFATECVLLGCNAVPLAVLADAIWRDEALFAVEFKRVDEVSAGIGVPPGIRPPIRTMMA